MICTHNVDGPAVAHIHRAPAGAIGPVVFDLGDPASPIEATWTNMTPADVNDLLLVGSTVTVHVSDVNGVLTAREVQTTNRTSSDLIGGWL